MENLKFKLLQTNTIGATANTIPFSFRLPKAKNYMIIMYAKKNGNSRNFDVSFTINNRREVRAKKTVFIQQREYSGTFPIETNGYEFARILKHDNKGLHLPLYATENTLVKGVLNAPAVTGSNDTIQIILKTWD